MLPLTYLSLLKESRNLSNLIQLLAWRYFDTLDTYISSYLTVPISIYLTEPSLAIKRIRKIFATLWNNVAKYEIALRNFGVYKCEKSIDSPVFSRLNYPNFEGTKYLRRPKPNVAAQPLYPTLRLSPYST